MSQSPPTENNKLALFDFDGTMTRTDTMLAFIKFVKGWRRLWLSLLLLSPYIILAKLGRYPAEKAKQRLLRYHFNLMPREELLNLGENFCLETLPRLFREDALEKLHFHRSRGHTVYIVSASLDIWLEPWLEIQGIPGIFTKTAWTDGKFTGDFATPNCNREEKVRRIRAEIDLKQFDRIYAYGDSKGDLPMLALAHRAFYRKF